LYALLERLLKRWHPRLAKSNIHYSLRAEGDIPAIQGDPNALEQVFVNLISNAVRAMEESGGNLALKLSARSNEREKQMVQVDCADSGCGIPPEVVERIFEPFFTTHPGGTGLGLSLAKQIITAHKGRITLTTQPGMTIFHVILPAAPSEEKQP
ncbi:MAG: GHKL domain-containing protein, partial [Anaerolineae bacterium]